MQDFFFVPCLIACIPLCQYLHGHQEVCKCLKKRIIKRRFWTLTVSNIFKIQCVVENDGGKKQDKYLLITHDCPIRGKPWHILLHTLHSDSNVSLKPNQNQQNKTIKRKKQTNKQTTECSITEGIIINYSLQIRKRTLLRIRISETFLIQLTPVSKSAIQTHFTAVDQLSTCS